MKGATTSVQGESGGEGKREKKKGKKTTVGEERPVGSKPMIAFIR
jgi:hypothetical protein